jgi:hypothetical protein
MSADNHGMRGDTTSPRQSRSLLALAFGALLLGQFAGAPVRAAAPLTSPSVASPTLAVGIAQLATAYNATANEATVSVTVSAPAATAPFAYTVAVRGTTIATGSASAPVTVIATNPCSVYTVSLTATVTDAIGATGSAATTLSRALCPAPPAVAHARDHIIAGATLTQASFMDQLRAKGSPALAQGASIYKTLVAARVNPAYALGTFQAESGSGTRGYAVITHNWGNILYRSWEAAYGAVPYAPGNGYTYAKYPDWLSSVRAYAHLVTLYDLDGYTTVSSASAHWLGTREGSTRHLTYLKNITAVMSILPDDAVPVMRTLTAPALSTGTVKATWSATDNVLVAGYRVHMRLGSGPWSASVDTTATSQTFSLAEGVWTMAVRAIDDAGNWSPWRTTSLRVDATAPVMTALAPSSAVVRSTDGKVTVHWSASDAVGVTGYQLRTRRTATGAWSSPSSTTATSRVFTLAPDTWYVDVRARDAAGNLGAWRESRIVVPLDDRSFAFSAGTHRLTSRLDYRGTYTTTSKTGAQLTTTFTGTGLYLVGRAGPSYGRFRVTVDGHSTLVDAGFYGGRRATALHTRVTLYSVSLADGPHTVTITNLGTTGRPTIALDGIGVVR